MKTQLTKPLAKELKKHVSIIHCSNTLTLLQRKISNVLLYNAYPCLKERETHKISVKELCSHLQYKGRNYDAIKEAMRTLVSTVMEWNLTNDVAEEDWTASAVLASVNIKGTICTYSYSPHMRDLLYSPSMYGKVNLLIQATFSSNYGLALYENCIRYRGLPQTKEFPLDLFRQIMGVGDKYRLFRDFKRRVLDKAVEEVNTLTDLVVSPVVKRVGNKVISITFKLKEREKKKRIFVENSCEDKGSDFSFGLVDSLEKIYKINNNKARNLIQKHGADKVSEKMKQIESSAAFVSGSIQNVAGYLIDALEKDYEPTVDSAQAINLKIRISDGEKLTKNIQEREGYLLRKKEADRRNSLLLEAIRNMQSSELHKFTQHFEETLVQEKDIFLLGKYQKHSFDHAAVQARMAKFIKDFYPAIWDKAVSA